MKNTINTLTETKGNDFLAEYPDVMTPEQVQKALQTGRNTVYGLLKDGVIRSLMIGGRYRIPKLYVKDFIYGTGDNNKENNEYEEGIER